MDDVYTPPRHSDLEDSYPGADGGGGGTPDTYRPLVVGRIELAPIKSEPVGPRPEPGSRLDLEVRVRALEKVAIRVESMRNWLEALDKRLAGLEVEHRALVAALDRHFSPPKKKRRKV